MNDNSAELHWSPNPTAPATIHPSQPTQNPASFTLAPPNPSPRIPPTTHVNIPVFMDNASVQEPRQPLQPPALPPTLPVQLNSPNFNRTPQIFPSANNAPLSVSSEQASIPAHSNFMMGTSPSTILTHADANTNQPPLVQSSTTPLASLTMVQEAVSLQNPQLTKPQVSITENERQFHLRPLNVKDALSYLDQVKGHFPDVPEVYNEFLSIMKDFKSQQIDTPGVIQRVSSLFRQHPQLIMGFNTFLPPGYRIEPTNDPNDPVKVSTPDSFYLVKTLPSVDQPARSVQVVPSGGPSIPTTVVPNFFQQTMSLQTSSTLPPTSNPLSTNQQVPTATPFSQPVVNPLQVNGANTNLARPTRPAVEFNHAINYVNKIKIRFSGEPETYKQFLEILKTYQEKQKPIHDVYDQVQVLFKNAPDLLAEFKQFLPEHGNSQLKQPNYVLGNMNSIPAPSVSPRHPAEPAKKIALNSSAASGASHTPTKRIPKRGMEKANNRESSIGKETNAPPVRKKPRTSARSAEKKGIIEELEFFDRCKKAIGNKATYTEFLKVLNLFSQEVIDAKTLVARIEPFLSKTPDLFEWFKKYVKREDDEVVQNVQTDRRIDYSGFKKTGASYRLLPNTPLVRSGLDDIGSEVLNTDWVSHPVYTSENGGFLSHHKNQFEEALYKCEDERYEFDLNIDANLSVISLLEPIARKIQDMPPEEKAKFKLGPNLGGTSNAIYKRVIKKVYDKARGEEVIELLQSNPAVAVPVVLKRLKQKDEEWKRSQREWNKVWRDIDARNHFKALDHQGIVFKQNDKKSIQVKTLQTEIEALYLEQRARRNAGENVIRHQMQFTFKDKEVFRDVQNLIFTMLDATNAEEDSITRFLKVFLPRFFWVDFSDIGPEFEEDDGDNAGTIPDKSSSGTKSQSPEPESAKRSSNMRRNVLIRNGKQSTSSTDNDDMVVDTDMRSQGSGTRENSVDGDNASVGKSDTDFGEMNSLEARTNFPFYGTSAIYYFFRLYQMAYSRLLKMKQLSGELSGHPSPSEKMNPIAVELGLQKKDSADESNTRERYKSLLNIIMEFLEGKLEATDFEDKCRKLYSTSAYFVFTMDKLIQAIIKQITQIVGDENKERMIKLYYRDRAKGTSTARQEAAYRIEAENLALDESLFRMEYITTESVLTIQAIGKEEAALDDTITKEEKWSMYVDHFVQIYPSEGPRLKRREPFLRRNFPRNFPSEVSEEVPGNISTRSGLELKICVNTYKIYFVEKTEDYFRRKFPPSLLKKHAKSTGGDFDMAAVRQSVEKMRNSRGKVLVKKLAKFRNWWETEEKGWKHTLHGESAEKLEGATREWMVGSEEGLMNTESDGNITRYTRENLFSGASEILDTERNNGDVMMEMDHE
ncbi:Transcriptional regulatory protein sin3 [Nowakowskiella sp. JEL0407]|nr:Transcriptional regulatory protein sin3 [Nowakowskiella sp. JEL0407]